MISLSAERKREHLDYAWKIANLFSKDDSTKVGAIIVDPVFGEIIPYGTGYNGLPRGCRDDIPERKARPEKYDWTEHAERNAIFNVARNTLENGVAILSYAPDIVAARAIASVGTKHVVYPESVRMTDARVETIFNESGVNSMCRQYEMVEHGLRHEKLSKYIELAGCDGKGAIFLSEDYRILGDVHGCAEDPARIAIYNVARREIHGCILFATMMPCSGCADAVIRSGIRHVVTERPDIDRWNANFDESAALLDKHGITCEVLPSRK